MKRTLILVVLTYALTVPEIGSASEPLALHELFPYEAHVTASGPGLCRMTLPPEVLSNCRQDLSDLRIFDARDREVAYVVDAHATDDRLQITHTLDAMVSDIDRHRRGAPPAPVRYTETYTIELRPLPPDVGSWELLVDSRRRRLVARIDIHAIAADGERTTVLADGALFRLEAPNVENRRFPVPLGDAVQLRVSVTNENLGYLEPAFRFQALRSLSRTDPMALTLEPLQIRRFPRRTEVVLDRPRGIVPTRLRLLTTTGAFHRRIVVWDEGPGSENRPLGERELLRLDAIVPVEVNEVRIRPPAGNRLRLVIRDLDSPPLDAIRVVAEVPRPALLFSLPVGSRQATLRFGGGRAHRPDYDLAAFAAEPGALNGTAEADRALGLWDPSRSRPAALGEIRPNPQYDPAPALAFAMRPGAELNPATFAHRRRLRVSPSQEGLSRLRLQPEDLARARGDLGDLRIIDEQDRQWAYLLRRGSSGALTALRVAERRSVDGRSRYTLEPPVSPLTVDLLQLEPDAQFFDRAFTVRGTSVDGERQKLHSGRLVRRRGDPRPVIISLPEARVQTLELVVDDGDDAPLTLRRVDARVPVADLFLVAPEGPYTLLLDDPRTRPPRYELERVRSTVLGVPANPVSCGDVTANPEYSPASRLAGRGGAQRFLLWGVLGVAVVALVVFTLRVARREGAE